MTRPTEQSTTNNAPLNQQKIEKYLQELLLEVSRGDYRDFRLFFGQNNMQNLDLRSRDARLINLQHLALALKGTNVTSIDLG